MRLSADGVCIELLTAVAGERNWSLTALMSLKHYKVLHEHDQAACKHRLAHKGIEPAAPSALKHSSRQREATLNYPPATMDSGGLAPDDTCPAQM
jgi:hypothetical protein